MKKQILKLISVVMIATAVNCSSENSQNSDNISLDDPNPMYLKKYINDVPTSPAYAEGIFEYNNGLLTNGFGACWFSGSFQYDNNGKLLSRQKNGDSFTYLYDNQNRVVKQLKTGSNDFISLSYNGNIITVTDSYSYFGQTPYVEVFEITTDSSGKILKNKHLTPFSFSTHIVQEYVYDNRNNITQKTYKENNAIPPQPDFSVNYQYDDKKNPFYYAYKKLYKSLYYIQHRRGIEIDIVTGVTPNNLTVFGSSTTFAYLYNTAGYPTKITQTYFNGAPNLATFDRKIEY